MKNAPYTRSLSFIALAALGLGTVFILFDGGRSVHATKTAFVDSWHAATIRTCNFATAHTDHHNRLDWSDSDPTDEQPEWVSAAPQTESAVTAADFCQRNHRPTFVIRPDFVEQYDTIDAMARTHFLSDDAQILAWAPQPPSEAEAGMPRRFADPTVTGGGAPRACPVIRVPASAEPQDTDHAAGDLLIGYATTPSRVLRFLPRWADYLPTGQVERLRFSRARQSAQRNHRSHHGALEARLEQITFDPPTASALVLTPPGAEPAASWAVVQVAKGAGIDVKLKGVDAPRFEARYFSLIREMWDEAQKREDNGGRRMDWFVFADDDTYFLSLPAIRRLLAPYNPDQALMVGSKSENQNAIDSFGNIAFGGAGIFVSRELMRRMNSPGHFEKCQKNYEGSIFGGDGMVSKCAADALSIPVESLLTSSPTLHQLDVSDEAHGVFQSGWRFASIHHYASWLQLQPKAHPHVIKDPIELVGLLGKAARSVGDSNWLRRYVFGLRPGQKEAHDVALLSLGYALTLFGSSAHLGAEDLRKVEATFAGGPLHADYGETRPKMLESKQRRNYYLKALRKEGQLVIMTHVNTEGEEVDVVWDGNVDAPAL